MRLEEEKLIRDLTVDPDTSLVNTDMSSQGNVTLRVGERVLMIDGKDRRRLVRLSSGAMVHTHAGVVPHDEMIGSPDCSIVQSKMGAKFIVVRPRLADVVLSMPRGAQVIYPKDLGPILMAADVFSGAKVLEAGVGSGAMSMALLRAGAKVIGYEIREDFAEKAKSNVTDYMGPTTNYRVEVRDVYEGIAEQNLDRVILDLPEPWRVLDHAANSMNPGGILLSYLPSITQVAELREAMSSSSFGLCETFEVMERGWHVEGRAVRPGHRMVGHTGFLTHARLFNNQIA